ncbi:MAG: phage holin family protein [Terriglobales bacterium]
MSEAPPPTPPNPADNPDASTIDMMRGLLQEAAAYGRDLVHLFFTELKEQSRSMKVLIGMAAAAGLFLTFAFCWLSLALVGVISYGIGSWRWALLIVGVGYAIIGLLMLIPVATGLKGALPTFEHTRRRIEEDTQYVKNKLAA